MERFSFRIQLPYRIDYVKYIERKDHAQVLSFPDGQQKHVLVYTAEGNMVYSFERTQLEVPCGEVIFIPQGTKHTTIYPHEGAHTINITFTVVGRKLPVWFNTPKLLGKCDIKNELEEIRKCIPHEPIRLYCLVFNLLERLRCENKRLPALNQKIIPAVQEIEQNYACNCRVADLAALCCMSESALRRLFQQYVGASPVDYRNTVRLHHAQLLLKSGKHSIVEVAEEVGFTNLSFFYRLYKRYFGYPPGEEKHE